MTRIPLSRLLAEGRSGEAVVADSMGVVSFDRFRQDVQGTAHRVQSAGCRRGVLAATDAYQAAVGVFGLLHAGSEVILPANAKPATLAAIQGEWDFLVSDDPPTGACSTLLIGRDHDACGDHLRPLNQDLQLTFFTSGSSATPKRIVRTLCEIEAEIDAIDAVLSPLAPECAWVHGTVSHQHIYGLAFRVLWPLMTGRPFGGPMHDLWESVLGALGSQDVLITGPAHLSRLQGIDPLPADRRPAAVLSAGSPLAADAAAVARSILGVMPLEVFGSTETGVIAHRRGGGEEKAWSPFPGVIVERNADGTMRVSGPSVAGATQSTADLIDMDEEGFRFRGRADRVVKVEGKRVSLPEVEERLMELPSVADAAALMIGMELPMLAAAVVLGPKGIARLSEIGSFRLGRELRSALAATHDSAGLPRLWRFVPELPMNPMGKRSQAAVAALFEAEAVRSDPPTQRPKLPEVIESRAIEAGIELDLRVPDSLAQLEGHFPQQPILPGVVQIDWAVKLAARYLDIADVPARQFQVKFRRIIVPSVDLTLRLKVDPALERLKFEYRLGSQVMTSGSVRLDDGGAEP